MYKRIKTLTGYAAHARFLATIDGAETDNYEPLGYITNPREIPSPYCHTPSRAVYGWNGKRVFIVETAHRRYEVFEVPASAPLFSDEAATNLYIAA